MVYIGVISVIIGGFFILFDGGMARSEEIPMSSVIALTENPPIGQRVNIIVNDELKVIQVISLIHQEKNLEVAFIKFCKMLKLIL